MHNGTFNFLCFFIYEHGQQESKHIIIYSDIHELKRRSERKLKVPLCIRSPLAVVNSYVVQNRVPKLNPTSALYDYLINCRKARSYSKSSIKGAAANDADKASKIA